MKLLHRIAALFCLSALALCLPAGPVRADSPDPKYDPQFTEARKLAADQPTKAIDEYAKVARNAKEPEVSGEALLRAALLASSKDYGTTDEVREQGVVRAHDLYKEMLQQYPTTNAAKWVVDHHLKEDLEARIDKHNSSYFSYQLVDKMVAMTGRIPAFSYWFALLLIAVIVKGLTFPLTLRMYKSQREMQRMQPFIKGLQEKYKDDKVVLNEKVMAAYKEHGVNPLASCLPMVVQMPFLFWIYNTIRLYEFHFTNGTFLWIGSALSHKYPEYLAMNMGQFDIPLLILYASSNYWTMKLTPATDPQAAQTQKTTAVMMTAMMFWMFLKYRWSAAFIFYWLALNAISAYQQYTYIYKPNKQNGGVAGTGTADGTGNGKGTPALETGAKPIKAAGNGAGSRAMTTVPSEPPRARPRRKKR